MENQLFRIEISEEPCSTHPCSKLCEEYYMVHSMLCLRSECCDKTNWGIVSELVIPLQ